MQNIYRHHASSHRLAPESVDKAVQVGGGLQLGGHIGHPLPLNSNVWHGGLNEVKLNGQVSAQS